MSETIKYSFSIQVAGGPKVADADTIEVEAYDMLEVEVPDSGTSGGVATVNVQPGDSGVKFLQITADSYEDLTYKVDGGSSQTLDGPLLLIGEGAVALAGRHSEAVRVHQRGRDGDHRQHPGRARRRGAAWPLEGPN